jgi:hypothetical protein
MPKNERDFKGYSAVSRKHKWEKTLLKKFSPGTWFPELLRLAKKSRSALIKP